MNDTKLGTWQLPEGLLIEQAQKRLGLSSRKAATQAGISDARWRNIVSGYQSAGAGQRIHVVAPADTLARMARVVGITADELRAVGRDDAAAIMGPPVGGGGDDADFVAAPGDRQGEGNVSNAELLAEIRVLRREVEQLKRRQEGQPE